MMEIGQQQVMDTSHITTQDASKWLVKMAVADGLLSPKEKDVLAEFAALYGLQMQPLLETAKQMHISGRPEVSMIDYCSKDGRDFENHVVSYLNEIEDLELLEWTGDKFYEGIYDQRNHNPDLHLRWHKSSGVEFEFWIECKWRSYWMKDMGGCYFEMNKKQLRRYRLMAKRMRQKVFVVLAIGHTGIEPEHIHVIPLRAFINSRITLKAVQKYRIDDTPHAFAKAIKRQFQHLGTSSQ